MTIQYKGGNEGGNVSSMGNQLQTELFWKKALIEAKKKVFFGQLANVRTMPKNMGKKIKQYHYIPLLDDANINDQGIDAAGVTIDSTKYSVVLSALTQTYAVEADATAAAAAVNAVEAGVAVKSGAVSPWTLTFSKLNLAPGTDVATSDVLAKVPFSRRTQNSGNLYGSSKDIGSISGKLPTLSENGGRVNRVGFSRKELEGTFEKFGFFDEYTQESMDFDSDPELEQHITREMLNAAHEMTEDALQIDLLMNAGVVKFAGNATSNLTVGGDDIVSYGDLMRLDIDLDNNRTPKQTTAITGTRLTDTRTISGGRVMYCGSEMIPTLRMMVDLHGEPAFIPVEKYAAGGTLLNGEIGSVGPFRIIVVPEMLKWAGAGADASADATCHETANKYDVFPMLVVGEESFTTIGFQTDGQSVKFSITHKKPGKEMADLNDPYGEKGFMSIKWYYGFMVLRPERLAIIKTAAKL